MTAAALGGFCESANFAGALELGIGGVGLNEKERFLDGGVRRGGGGGGAVVVEGGRGAIIHEEEEGVISWGREREMRERFKRKRRGERGF